jgi:hypothetical protein
MPLKLYLAGKVWHYRGTVAGNGYADLVKQRTKPLRRVRLPRSKPASGNVVSMDRKRS